MRIKFLSSAVAGGEFNRALEESLANASRGIGNVTMHGRITARPSGALCGAGLCMWAGIAKHPSAFANDRGGHGRRQS